MTNLKDDLNSWMSAVNRFTSCPVLLASKKATSCLRAKNNTDCSCSRSMNIKMSHSHINNSILSDVWCFYCVHAFFSSDREWLFTSVRMRRGSSSCLLPPSPPPLKAGWCSHLLASPIQRRFLMTSAKLDCTWKSSGIKDYKTAQDNDRFLIYLLVNHTSQVISVLDLLSPGHNC